MKTFDNIQQLWDYCEFCPLCQEYCRRVWASVGPDPSFDLTDYKKEGNILTLQCYFRSPMNKWSVDYKINCLNNICEIEVPWTDSSPIIQETKDAYFYFWIQGECNKCGNTFVASQDIELDSPDTIGMETETIHLLDDKLRLVLLYEDDEMHIVQRSYDTDETYLSVDSSMILPITEIDWRDQSATIERIRSWMVFS